MTKKRIVHYLIISFLLSLFISAFWVKAPSTNGQVGLSSTDEIPAILIYMLIIFCYVLVIGGVTSTVVRLFTNNLFIILITYLIIGIVLYYINPWFSSNNYILIVSALAFGISDQLFIKIWGDKD